MACRTGRIVAELAGGEWTTKLKGGINECDEEGLQEPSFENYLIRSLKEFCEACVKRPSVTARRSDEQRDHISTDDILSPSEGLNSDHDNRRRGRRLCRSSFGARGRRGIEAT